MNKLIDDLAVSAPEEWNINQPAIDYIKRYLLSEERLETIKKEALEYVKY